MIIIPIIKLQDFILSATDIWIAPLSSSAGCSVGQVIAGQITASQMEQQDYFASLVNIVKTAWLIPRTANATFAISQVTREHDIFMA